MGLLKSQDRRKGPCLCYQHSIIEPLGVEFAALIGADERPEFDPSHPWGCHRRRIPDRVVFDHLIAALVHGSGYERIATTGCSDRTLRRRLREWAEAGHGPALLRICLAAYDRISSSIRANRSSSASRVLRFARSAISCFQR
jgi:hypothetical protein